jgi:hypothetical protein
MDDRGARPKRDRPIFFDLLLIAAVMAFLMWGGLKLLARTHSAWDTRYGDRAEPPPAALPPAATQAVKWSEADEAEYARLKKEAEQRLRAFEANEQHTTRCIAGTLFKVDGNSYTNVGRC